MSNETSTTEEDAMTTETPPARTRGPRPSRATQPAIVRVDVSELEQSARTVVAAEFAALTDLDDRLARAVEIIEVAEGELTTLRPRRDAMAVSLALYDNVRAVSTMAGLGRTQMAKIRRAALGGKDAPLIAGTQRVDREAYAAMARKAKIKHVAHALEDLPPLAERVVYLEARASAARKIRDDAAVAMLAAGTKTKTEVARLIGRGRSLVSHRLVGRAGV